MEPSRTKHRHIAMTKAFGDQPTTTARAYGTNKNQPNDATVIDSTSTGHNQQTATTGADGVVDICQKTKTNVATGKLLF